MSDKQEDYLFKINSAIHPIVIDFDLMTRGLTKTHQFWFVPS